MLKNEYTSNVSINAMINEYTKVETHAYGRNIVCEDTERKLWEKAEEWVPAPYECKRDNERLGYEEG